MKAKIISLDLHFCYFIKDGSFKCYIQELVYILVNKVAPWTLFFCKSVSYLQYFQLK